VEHTGYLGSNFYAFVFFSAFFFIFLSKLFEGQGWIVPGVSTKAISMSNVCKLVGSRVSPDFHDKIMRNIRGGGGSSKF